MNGKPNSSLISSTPHHRKNQQILDYLFDDEIISPIAIPNLPEPKVPVKSARTTSRNVKTKLQIDAVLPKRRKNAVKTKEPVSNDVFKELGLTAETARGNLLSQSRNLYNMFPEPIILESDEEEESKTVIVNNQKKPVKKTKNVKKSMTAERVDNKRKVDEKSEEKSSKPDQRKKRKSGQSNNQVVSVEDITPSVVIGDEDEEESLFPELRQTGNLTDSDKIKHRIPLEELIGVDSSKQAIKTLPIRGRKSNTVQRVKTDKNVDDNLKKVHVGILHENLTDADSIKQATITLQNRRRKSSTVKRVKTEKNIYVNLENVKNVDCKIKNSSGNKYSVTKKTKPSDSVGTNLDSDKDDDASESNFPTECLSIFKDVVFKRSKTNGGIIAKGIETDSIKCGFIDISQGEVFTGSRSNVLFLLLEGKVKISLQGVQKSLSPGDSICIPNGSEYQFYNIGNGHARFHYVMVKQ